MLYGMCVNHAPGVETLSGIWNAERFAKNGTEFDAKYAAEIGKAGDVTFYNYMEPNEDYTDGLEKEYAEEYRKLRGALEDAFTKAEYTAPEA